jgi:hypothetical protein
MITKFKHNQPVADETGTVYHMKSRYVIHGEEWIEVAETTHRFRAEELTEVKEEENGN